MTTFLEPWKIPDTMAVTPLSPQSTFYLLVHLKNDSLVLLLIFGFAVSTKVLEREGAQSPEGAGFKSWSLLGDLGTDTYLLHLSLPFCRGEAMMPALKVT